MGTNRHLSFSTTFPSYHPKVGQSTYFIEKIWSGLLQIDPQWYGQFLPGFDEEDDREFKLSYSKMRSFEPKYHTIRIGHRFNVGDGIIPFVWSGLPYRSKWIKPFYNGELVIPVKRVWDFKVKISYVGSKKVPFFSINGSHPNLPMELTISKNDGFKFITDFVDWFNEPFSGQIITWNPNLRYLDSDPIPKPLPPTNPNRKIIKLQ